MHDSPDNSSRAACVVVQSEWSLQQHPDVGDFMDAGPTSGVSC